MPPAVPTEPTEPTVVAPPSSEAPAAEPRTNELGQPIGPPVTFTPPPLPGPGPITGDEVALRPLRLDDAAALLAAIGGGDGSQWTYLPAGPCRTAAELAEVIAGMLAKEDQLAYLITDRGGVALGTASFVRAQPAAGSVEVGWIVLGPRLRRSRAGTEAMYLLARHAFDLGYRRYEWKCDALNAPSRAAAERLGFTYEGTFRQAVVYKNRNRDTAWFSITDGEWPLVRAALETWLAETPRGGDQRRSLTEVRRSLAEGAGHAC